MYGLVQDCETLENWRCRSEVSTMEQKYLGSEVFDEEEVY